MNPGAPDDPINFGGVGDIDMLPRPTYDGAKLIFEAGLRFAPQWQAALSAIRGEERQLGKGRLGAAFIANYNGLEEQLTPAVSAVAPTYVLMGQAGVRSVRRAVESAGRVADGFRELLV